VVGRRVRPPIRRRSDGLTCALFHGLAAQTRQETNRWRSPSRCRRTVRDAAGGRPSG